MLPYPPPLVSVFSGPLEQPCGCGWDAVWGLRSALLALEDKLVQEAADDSEEKRVGQVHRHRRATRRETDEDTRDERIEQNRVKQKTAKVHLLLAATIFTRPNINEQHRSDSSSCEQGRDDHDG